MTRKITLTYSIFLAGLALGLGACRQQAAMRSADTALAAEFREMMQADRLFRFDVLAPAFKQQMAAVLIDKQSMAFSFPELSAEISIAESRDQNLRIYSWDEAAGGTWPDITAIAQFKTAAGWVKVQPFDADGENGPDAWADSIIYEINELVSKDKTHYLTIGAGSRGSGQHHVTVEVFKIEADALVKCKNCFAGDRSVVIEAPRTEKINLAFDDHTNTVTHNEFIFNDDTGFYEYTGSIVTWQFLSGQFKKIQAAHN